MLRSSLSISRPSIISPFPNHFSSAFSPLSPSFPKSQFRPLRTITSASNSNGGDDSNQVGEEKETPSFNGRSSNGGGLGGAPFLPNINWANLLLNPDPDNLIAVALTGLLSWASLQLLWQLFTISLAILVAALKYSFIAALLIFILITLL